MIWPNMSGSVYLSRDWYQVVLVLILVLVLVPNSVSYIWAKYVSKWCWYCHWYWYRNTSPVNLSRNWYWVGLVLVLILVLVLASIIRMIGPNMSPVYLSLDWYQVVQRCRTSGGVPPLYISSLFYLLPLDKTSSSREAGGGFYISSPIFRFAPAPTYLLPFHKTTNSEKKKTIQNHDQCQAQSSRNFVETLQFSRDLPPRFW